MIDSETQDWSRIRVVGRRTAFPPPGLEGYGRLVATANALRQADIVRPRGVHRFSSFEEAQRWWETNWTVRPRAPQPPTT